MSEQLTTTSFEACIEALRHVERRRLLLSLLNDSPGGDPTVVLDQLDTDAADDALRVSMHHNHLPKLVDLGFVAADSRQNVVTVGPEFDEIRPLLELLDDNRTRLPDGLV